MTDRLLEPELPEASYHANRSHVSASWLKTLATKTPAHLRADLDGERKETDAMFEGSLLHRFILEPERAQGLYVPVARRTAKVKEELAADGKIPALQRQIDLGNAIAERIWAHPTAAKLIAGANHIECSVFWREPATGTPCKARADVLGEVCMDLKSTKDASPPKKGKPFSGFGKQVGIQRYDLQAAHYAEGFGVPFGWIAFEKEPPYAVGVYFPSTAMKERAFTDRAALLKQYRECVESNHWPAYSDEPVELELPA